MNRRERSRARREIEDLADREPRRGRLVARQIADELMHERQEHGFDGDISGAVVERRRPDDHAAEASLPLNGRRGTIVEAGEYAIARSWLEGAVAEKVRGGEIAAARRLEHLEDWMAVVEEAERTAASRHAIDRTAEFPGKEIRFVRGAARQRRAIAGDDEYAAAALDEALQRAARTGRVERVVQHDDGSFVERRR